MAQMFGSDGEAWIPVAGEDGTFEMKLDAGVLWKTYDKFNNYMYQIADRRSRDMFLLGRMDGMILLTMGYLAFVFLGPKLMKKREAFQMRSIMLVYNIFLVALSAWMCLSFLINSRISNYNFRCVPYRDSDEPSELRIVNVLWWYYVSKAIEFMDTVFMILKKKQDQVTFLHVYHHIVMFPLFYFIMMIGPCCQAVFSAMLNSFIHVLMYSYYGLALFPVLHKYLWWKRYLTQLQLLQFFAVLIQLSVGFLTSCSYPMNLYYLNIGFVLSLILLFSNFYIRSYIQRTRQLLRRAHPQQQQYSANSTFPKTLHTE